MRNTVTRQSPTENTAPGSTGAAGLNAGNAVGQLPGGAGTKSAGQRQFVGNLARAAAGAGIDGVFMEVHDNPAEALSDGPNMLYLSQVEDVLRDMMAINEIAQKSVSTDR